MNLNDLLAAKEINPSQRKQVLVMRHTPHEHELREVLPWLASENPRLFNAYQQTQSKKAEQMLTKATYLASFIGLEGGEALFVGLYKKVGRSHSLSFKEFWRVRAYQELQKLGMLGFQKGERGSCLRFDLRLTDIYVDWKGKLIVQWPGLERAWCRWADRNEFPVKAILQESLLVSKMPEWNELTLTWEQLKKLPNSWRSALAQWRGIYLIVDKSDGKAYVGAAYGRENIYGRWRNYKTTGHGGNKKLRNREPENFTFSVLQLVNDPTEDPKEVIRIEETWKKRLQTCEFGLNDKKASGKL